VESGAQRRSAARSEDMLKVGDKAPDFRLPSDAGTEISLKDFRGKPLVLFFFPKADTPG
jgi:peroxiredoxin Q/BCP